MKNIVILTGAGISAESGIHTYRDEDGLWTKFSPREVSHIDGWRKDPQKVLDFKNMLRRQFAEANYQPNAAHHALAKLQREWPHGTVTIVTQNIDGLHRDAGAEVMEIHGSGRHKFCENCGHISLYKSDILLDDPCVQCGTAATTRPMVVFFGEMPMQIDVVEHLLDTCAIYATIGSSCEVMPASLFPVLAKQSGAETFLFNKDEVRADTEAFDHIVYGPATETVTAWVDGLLAEGRAA